MKILAIETSCDETALALVEANGELVEPRFKVLQNLVASQIKIHRPFGGVVPNLAKREHLKNLPLLWKRIMIQDSGFKNRKLMNRESRIVNPAIDLIAVTVGPGLEPALWTGIEFAKALKKKLDVGRRKSEVRIIGTNHLEGHLYSFLLPQKTSHISLPTSDIFPAIALLVSGGHTILLRLDSLMKRKKLGETRDDAVGEAFDKVARMLKLPYPGGPEIEKLARKGNPKAINFPRPMLAPSRSSTGMHYNYDFSFSGLKTAVLYYLRDTNIQMRANDTNNTNKADIAASFQQAAIDVLVTKTLRAAKEFRAKSILLSGGVAANKLLRKTLKAQSLKLKARFFVPDFIYNTDNAAMIAAAGYITHLRGKKYRLTARGDMNI